MKTLYYTLFIFLIQFFFTDISSAQYSATTMQDILQTVNDKVIYLEDDKDQEIVNITIDLIVGGGEKRVYRKLDPSFDYEIMVIGDRRISKTYLNVNRQSDEGWQNVQSSSSKSPLIKITPPDYVQYEFIISVDEFKKDYTTGHFALIIYHRDPLKSK